MHLRILTVIALLCVDHSIAEPRSGTDPTFADSDGDNMSDSWELLHGLDPLDPSDALLDTDNDGVMNVEEFRSNSDPERYVIHLEAGWNLVSLGTQPQEHSATDIFGNAYGGAVWTWHNGRFQTTTEIHPHKGYWVYALEQTDIEVQEAEPGPDPDPEPEPEIDLGLLQIRPSGNTASFLENTVNERKNVNAFAALKTDGSITAWGLPYSGGDGAPTDNGYIHIYSNVNAFAAIKSDGSITAWGTDWAGGSGAPTDTGYTEIFSTWTAFSALKGDGSITFWGRDDDGATGAPTDNGYIHIFSNARAFAALKADGSITAWGNLDEGGGGAPTDNGYVIIADPMYMLGE